MFETALQFLFSYMWLGAVILTVLFIIDLILTGPSDPRDL